MPEQILKAVDLIPSLNDTKWEMYDVKDAKLVDTKVFWHFTPPNDVDDGPVEIWQGHWNKKDDNRIEIERRNVQSPFNTYKYNAVFAGPDVFVANGDDETKNRTLIAIRMK